MMRGLETKSEAEIESGDASAVAARRLRMTVRLCGVFLTAVLVAFVGRHYYIKAWSDPLNYLEFAREFESEFFTNRFACVYPLFLRLMEPLLGTYGLFLVNLPLVAVMGWAVGALAAATVRPADRPFRGAAAVLAFALVLLFDPRMLIYLTNPYRDPLAHIFLVGSLLLVAWELWRPPPRLSRVGLAGVCLGLAYSTREPSVLMAGPLGVLLLAEKIRHREMAFWKTAGAAAAGLLLGALPILLQGWLREESSFLLPPQSATQGFLVPGMQNGTLIRFNLPRAAEYLLDGPGAAIAGLALAGTAWAAWRRQWFSPLVLVGGAALYIVFYSDYWTFVARYFYVSVLLLAAAAAGGVAQAGAGLAARWPAAARTAMAVLLAAVSLAVGVRLLARPAAPGFRIPQARQFAADIARHVPSDAVVYAPRHLCEMLRWFNRIESRHAQSVWWGAGNPVPYIRTELAAHFAAGRRVFVIDAPVPGRTDPDTAAFRRGFDLAPVAAFASAAYHLKAVSAIYVDAFDLLEVKPWTRREVETRLPPPPASPALLRVDARTLWPSTERRRTWARCRVNGATVAERLVNGANYLWIDAPGGTDCVVRLESDAPVSPELPAEWIAPAERLVFDLDLASDPSHLAYFGEGFDLPVYAHRGPIVRRRGTLRIPAAVLKDRGGWLIRVTGSEPGKNEHVQFSVDGGQGAIRESLPKDRRFRVVAGPWPLAVRDGAAHAVFEIENPREGALEATENALEFDQIRFLPRNDSAAPTGGGAAPAPETDGP